jgi:hypothetical protein
MEPQQYVADIKAKLVASAAVATITIVEERLLPDRGYFRARLTLRNNDFLEVAEYFVVEAGRCMTRRYRYQWTERSTCCGGDGITWNIFQTSPIFLIMSMWVRNPVLSRADC